MMKAVKETTKKLAWNGRWADEDLAEPVPGFADAVYGEKVKTPEVDVDATKELRQWCLEQMGANDNAD